MRGLSLFQPWATAIALGSKRIETRSWQTGYRGLVAIHASKRKRVSELLYLRSCWGWCGAMRGAGWRMGGGSYVDELPFGAVVALAQLVQVRPTGVFTQAELDARRMPEGETLETYGWTERTMGDYALGRFGWILEDVRPLSKPYPYKGGLGMWRFKSDADVEAVLALAEQGDS
jgi:hypothetical protein